MSAALLPLPPRPPSTLERCARLGKGPAWAIYSQAVQRCLADPSDDNAATVRTAFAWHVRMQAGRPPSLDEIAAVEGVIGREFPEVLTAAFLERLVERRSETIEALRRLGL